MTSSTSATCSCSPGSTRSPHLWAAWCRTSRSTPSSGTASSTIRRRSRARRRAAAMETRSRACREWSPRTSRSAASDWKRASGSRSCSVRRTSTSAVPAARRRRLRTVRQPPPRIRRRRARASARTGPLELRRLEQLHDASPTLDQARRDAAVHDGHPSGRAPAARVHTAVVKVRVDSELCVGHGRCYALADDVFEPTTAATA